MEIDIRPEVASLRMFAAMKYTAWFALGEFVDNAITSAEQNAERLEHAHPEGYTLQIDIRLDDSGVIEIADNAAGIARNDLARALRTASPPPDTRFLSIYGVGMKAAGLWWANTLTIETTALGERTRRTVTIDTRDLDSSTGRVHVDEQPARPSDHGTVIRLSNVTKKLPEGRTLGKVRAYLASMYRNFLIDGSTDVTVKGVKLAFEYPEVLNEPFWPSTAGPDSAAKKKTWEKELEIPLSTGQTVTGWVGLLSTGSTTGAGFLLTFHGKAVVGVGAGTAEGEELYRPREIFGGSNSFRRQRLVGEFDVSDFGKSITSDAVNWQDYEEEEFLTLLRRKLTAKSMDFLAMADNYRAKGPVGPSLGKAAQQAAKEAMEALKKTAASNSGLIAQPTTQNPPTGKPPVTASSHAEITVPLPGRSADVAVCLSVVEAGNADWLNVYDNPGRLEIRVNAQHPFMQSFAQLPLEQIEPVLRLALGLGVAEYADPEHVRARLNALLRGPLATRKATIE